MSVGIKIELKTRGLSYNQKQQTNTLEMSPTAIQHQEKSDFYETTRPGRNEEQMNSVLL